MIFTVELVASKVNSPLSSVKHNAHGFPVAVAVNFATVALVLMPPLCGFAMNSSGGLEAFSVTTQFHSEPVPAGSKSTVKVLCAVA